MYSVRILRVALKDIEDLPRDYTRLVSEHIEQLAENPRPVGVVKLQGDGGYRIRVGVYRVLYDIDDKTQEVIVYRIRHRREVYR
jgi:mRNA interferase RelE/StbE